MKTRILRILVDAAMTALLLLLMAYSMVGEEAHEWIGLAMLILFLLHHGLNRRWLHNLGRGRYSGFRRVQTAIALLLLVAMRGSMASGVLLSQYVFAFLPVRTVREIVQPVHILGAYWGFLLMSLHIGLNGNVIFGMLRQPVGTAASRTRTIARRLLAAGICIRGAAAFVQNHLVDYLFLRTHFVMYGFDQTLPGLLMDYLSMMGLFACAGYYSGKLLQRRKNR